MLRVRMFGLALLAVLAMSCLCAIGAQARWGKGYLPNATVITQDGKTLQFYDDLIKDKIFVISFLFTTCKDICPLATARLAELQEKLGDSMGRDIFFYSISIDPETDTPERLKQYADAFRAGPGWLFLTGKPEDIHAIRYKLGDRSRVLSEHRNEILLGNGATGEWARNNALGDLDSLALTVRGMDPKWRPQAGRSAYRSQGFGFRLCSATRTGPVQEAVRRMPHGRGRRPGGTGSGRRHGATGSRLAGELHIRSREDAGAEGPDRAGPCSQIQGGAHARHGRFKSRRGRPAVIHRPSGSPTRQAVQSAGAAVCADHAQGAAACPRVSYKASRSPWCSGSPIAQTSARPRCSTGRTCWPGSGADGDQLKVLFVSVDSERDTPEALKAYMASFDPRIVALTGSAAEIAGAARAFDAFYEKVTDGGGFTFDHSTKTYFVGRDGRLAGAVDLRTPDSDRRKALDALLVQR